MHTEDDLTALAEKLGKTKVWKKGTYSETIELSEAIGWNSVYRLTRVALEDGEIIRLPRKLVNSIHAELRGIIFKEQLEPEQCGYRCQIYEHAEVLKKYLEPSK